MKENNGTMSVTTRQVKEELESYKRYTNKLEYLENKILNIKAVNYDYKPSRSIGENKEATNINDYLEMKEECLKEMKRIRNLIEQVKNVMLRDTLFYRYVERMTVYEVSNIMECSESSVYCHIRSAIKELTKVINELKIEI